MPRFVQLKLVLLLSWVAAACTTAQQGLTPAPVHPASAAGSLALGAAKPGASSPLTAEEQEWVERTLSALTPRQRIAQLIMPWVGGGYSAEGSPDFEQVRKWVEEDEVGGLVLSIGSPLSYALKLNAMQRRARVPLLVASDMENGPGMRLGNSYAFPSLLPQGGGTVFPPVMALGATRTPELAFELGRVLGLEARAVGVHLAFGPVLDVNSNPLNPVINTRSFGEDPELVSAMAAAYVQGARSAGLMTTAKHFPGHGDTHVDSHISLPTIDADRARLDTVDLPPFRAATEAGIDAVMTAHIAVPAVEGDTAPPATLSRVFMTDILRTDIGFRGLLVTDAMTMGAVARRYGATEPLLLALEAGADVLLMPRSVPDAIATVAAAVEAGRISPERIDRSVRKILEMKVRAGLHRGRLVELDSIPTIVNVPAHVATAATIAGRSIVLARDSMGAVPLARRARLLSLTYAESDDPIAGRIFDSELRSAGHAVTSARVGSETGEPAYAALLAGLDSVDAVVISAYV